MEKEKFDKVIKKLKKKHKIKRKPRPKDLYRHFEEMTLSYNDCITLFDTYSRIEKFFGRKTLKKQARYIHHAKFWVRLYKKIGGDPKDLKCNEIMDYIKE